MQATSSQGLKAKVLFVTSCITVISLLLGCTSSLPPAKQSIAMPGQSKANLTNTVSKALLSGGYEIKFKDESAGIIDAFRPLTGTFSAPGYGHKVAISLENNNVHITVFPAVGVLGGETPEQVKNEVMRLIEPSL